jgi:hypothetical protein
MEGLLEANDRMRDDGLDQVLRAAATAFGFVYINPSRTATGAFIAAPPPDLQEKSAPGAFTSSGAATAQEHDFHG